MGQMYGNGRDIGSLTGYLHRRVWISYHIPLFVYAYFLIRRLLCRTYNSSARFSTVVQVIDRLSHILINMPRLRQCKFDNVSGVFMPSQPPVAKIPRGGLSQKHNSISFCISGFLVTPKSDRRALEEHAIQCRLIISVRNIPVAEPSQSCTFSYSASLR